MKNFKILAVALIAITIFSSCKKEGCTDPEALNYNPDAKNDDGTCEYPPVSSLTFQFDHSIDGGTIAYDNMKFTNEAGNTYSIITLQYIVSDIILHKKDGSTYLIDTFHYRDARDAATYKFVVEDIPDGHYTGISFTFGLDEEDNVNNALPNESIYNNMAWPSPLGVGYHFMKFEGKFTDTTSSNNEANFALHTGSINNDTANHQNFINIKITDNFDLEIAGDKWEIHLMMNTNEWFKNPETINLYNGWNTVMANQSKQQILKANGTDLFTIHHIHAK